jgi:hypothetical protein
MESILNSVSRNAPALRPERVRLVDLVVMARVPTPDPIPNSAVKALSADGTASQDVGE